MEIVESCGDLTSLMAAIERQAPDVVVTDIRMPPDNSDEGIRIAAELREGHPEIGVVVLSQYSEPGYVLRLFEAGSDGRAYLLKERVHSRGELVAAIEAVASGGAVIDPKVVEVLIEARAARGAVAAGRADSTRARGPARDRRGQEQRCDRRRARADQARR